MLKPGQHIDVWVVERALGRGGMGSVYRCHNREATRILAAVKVLDPALQHFDHAKARFVREAEILFTLDHPHIVKVRNIRMDVATPYIEMEFVDGIDLEQHVRSGPLRLYSALLMFRQVAEALAHMHARGVRHRDIKPANVLVQPHGAIKVVDFGIATEAEGLRLTGGDQAFGSISYVPPEWLDAPGDPVLWDIYSTGLVFWELLAGRQAFPLNGRGTAQQEMVRILAEKARVPHLDPGPGVPDGLRALLADMTRNDPAARASSAAEILERLDAVAAAMERAREAGPTLVPRADDPRPKPTPRGGPAPARVTSPAWQPVLPGASPVSGTDPSYATGSSRKMQWLEVRWHSPAVFADWCRSQLENYMLVMAVGSQPLPTAGRVRMLLSFGAVAIDCVADVRAAGPTQVAWRLDLDALQIDRLRRWREDWERRREDG